MKKGSKKRIKPKIDRKAKLMSWLIVLFLVLAIMNLVIGIAYLSNMQIQVSKPIMPVFTGTIPYIYAVDFLTAVVLVGMGAFFDFHLKNKYGRGFLAVALKKK